MLSECRRLVQNTRCHTLEDITLQFQYRETLRSSDATKMYYRHHEAGVNCLYKDSFSTPV
jgi:hypothetical protein